MHPRKPALSLALAAFAALAWAPSVPAATPAPTSSPGTTDTTPAQVGFTSLDPARTGLMFTNRLTPLQAASNRNLMNGSGVATGDVDGDGRCDVFFASISGPNALYRNLGDWRFQDISTTAGVRGSGWPSTGAVLADLEGDGDLDLLVSTLGQGVHCFRNDGTARFVEVTTEAGLASTTGSTTLALGDIDGDDDLDLYVANYGALSVLRSGGRAEVRRVNGEWTVLGPHAHRLRFVEGRLEEVGEADVLYLNDGRGTFTAVPWNSPTFLTAEGSPQPAPLDYGLGAQIRDLNGDGAPDIYVCNDFQTPDRFWLNDGRGRFQAASRRVQRKQPYSSMGVDFADVDRDGRLDFLVVEMSTRHHARRMRQVMGADPIPNLPGRFEARPQVPHNVLYHANDDGTWSDIAEYAGLAATDWSWQPVFADVDLDGYEDLLVVNGVMFDVQDRDTLAAINQLGRQTPEARNQNLLRYPPFLSPNLAFRNRGDLTFEERSTAWGFDSTRISQGIALADLDNDGDQDVVVNCLNDGALLYRNNSTAPRLAVRLRGRAPNPQGIGARLEVRGGPVTQTQEIVAGGRYLSGDEACRTFACGISTQLTVTVTWRSGRSTILRDVRPNAQLLVEEPAASEPPPRREGTDAAPPSSWFTNVSSRLSHTHHEELFDDFARQPLLDRQLSSLGPGIAFADLDGDAHDELVIGTGRGGRLGGFRFSAAGQAQPLESSWVAPDDVTGFTAWQTPDGKPALLAALATYERGAASGPGLIQITLRPGSATLDVQPLDLAPTGGASPGPLAAADFDGDGDLDLFLGARVRPGAFPLGGGSRLFLNDGGRLQDVVTNASDAGSWLQGLGMVSGAAWIDLENDGFPELVVASDWGPLRILSNDRGRLSAWDPPVSSGAAAPGGRLSQWDGWWTSVTGGDFDGDGRLDLVAGNWGLNTGHRANPAHPLRLYHGLAAETGPLTLVEAYYCPELRKDVPRRSLNALGQALPSLAARFPSHEAFGLAGVDEVLTAFPQRPAEVTARTLATTVFLNRPEGFVALPLPAEAQFAPVFGLAVADADGDGHEDLFVAQNLFATRVEWPRTDAGRGLWLRGLGDGRFLPLGSATSGVVILGEQRGAAVGDFDGDGRPDLVVAQNGAQTTLWRNTRAPSGLEVQVTGPPGNPSAYGATLRGRSAVGWGPRVEIRAGAGYWSQSAARAFLAGTVPLEEVEVRWPGGRTRRVQVTPGTRALRVGE